jgi:hypothetical protein
MIKKDPSPQKGRVGWGRGRKTLTDDPGQVACPVGGYGSRTHLDLTAVVAKLLATNNFNFVIPA